MEIIRKYIIFDDYLPYKVNNKNREAPIAINEIINTYSDKIKNIGLIDDILEIYTIKHNNPILDNNNNIKNIDYIIQKI